jgi:hypothetical protein
VISYELGMGFSIIAVILMTGTLVTQDIVNQQGLIQTVPIGNTGTRFTSTPGIQASGTSPGCNCSRSA